LGERILVPAAQQRREHLRSLLDERGLASRTKHIGKVSKRTGLLPCGVDELLRTTGLTSGVAEPGQQCRHRGTDGGLRIVAVKTERGSYAPDHVGGQELHDK
jgi:hypothetical protein